MKSSAEPYIEELRDEVRRLQTEIADLEAEFQPARLEVNQWDVWPYTTMKTVWAGVSLWGERQYEKVDRYRLRRDNLRRLTLVKGSPEFEGTSPLSGLKLV